MLFAVFYFISSFKNKTMKPIFCLLLLAFSIKIYCQKNFEGEIIYKNISTFDKQKNGFIYAFLKGNKLLLSNEVKKDEIPIYTLYDFNIGKSFVKMEGDSMVVSSNLIGSYFVEQKDSTIRKRKILTYDCYEKEFATNLSFSKNIKNIKTIFSDKIIFKVPIKMRFISPPIIFFNDSCISLATKITSDNLLKNKNIEIKYQAVSINNNLLSDSLFEIPKYLKEISITEYSKILMGKVNINLQKLGVSEKDMNEIIKNAKEEFNKNNQPKVKVDKN